MADKQSMIPSERIEKRIYFIRQQKVMLSIDLAVLYEVHPNLKSQIVISSWGGLRRATPYAFTEQGVAMLSSVLRSKRAIQVNIEIMRTFVKLKQMLASDAALARKLTALEKKYDAQFKVVFDAIRQLMTPPVKPKSRIGFHSVKKSKRKSS